jgi:hypothetical protein
MELARKVLTLIPRVNLTMFSGPVGLRASLL